MSPCDTAEVDDSGNVYKPGCAMNHIPLSLGDFHKVMCVFCTLLDVSLVFRQLDFFHGDWPPESWSIWATGRMCLEATNLHMLAEEQCDMAASVLPTLSSK